MRIGIAVMIVGGLALGCNAFTDPDEIPRPICASDADCDDGLFCNGPELCDAADPGADGYGCRATGAETFLDDGIDCTTDRCDETAGAVIHDAAGCECEDDSHCAAIHAGPCLDQATCAGGVCNVELVPEGSPCDDGRSCTTQSACDAAGNCAGGTDDTDDTLCDDGIYCNGAETCSPEGANSNPVSGCVPGTPPATIDLEIPCAQAFCDEDEDVVVPTPTGECECQTALDCGVADDCRAWRCDAIDGFTCRDDGASSAGSECDDGVECTLGDECDADGICAGSLAHGLCEDQDPCNGQEACAPDEGGCVDGVPPDPLPEECR
jgi:hypothetical protein